MTLKKLALALLLMTGMAAGQGFRWNGPQIVDSTGRPVPNATVRVCNEPTSNPTSCDTPSSIYSNRGLTTPLPNPTTADSNGNPSFYALAGRYHVQVTDPSITQIDIPDIILVQDGTYPQVNYTAVTFSATPTFDASIGTIFALTLTGNVTSSTVSNPSLGRLIEFQLCQDGTGSRTFAWPSDFDSPPVLDTRVSKCSTSAWFYNGTKWKMFGSGGDSTSPPGGVLTSGAVRLSFPLTSDTIVGKATVDTLTNKTLSGDSLSGTTTNSGTISGGTISGATVTLGTLTSNVIAASNTIADGALSANVALYNNGSKTWGPGSGFTWTFDASGGTDPTIAFASGRFNFTGNIQTPDGSGVNPGTSLTIQPGQGGLTAGTGGDLTLSGGSSGTGGAGGNINIFGGTGSSSGAASIIVVSGSDVATAGGGGVIIVAGAGALTSGAGGNISITAGSATAGASNGGNMTFTAGSASGGGTTGQFRFSNGELRLDALSSALATGSANRAAIFYDSTPQCLKMSTNNGSFFCVPMKVAEVDLTAQTAAVVTTTLYAVPSSGQGQYRLGWNAKITTAAGTSSTLGALTIVYTDPDGVAVTLTMPATIAAGTIATTSAANTTGTVLEGLSLTLNCKASTNITYAFAYASNAANAMNYNLHLKLIADF